MNKFERDTVSAVRDNLQGLLYVSSNDPHRLDYSIRSSINLLNNILIKDWEQALYGDNK